MENKTLTDIENRIKKGCGKKRYTENGECLICGKDYICFDCQAQLQLIKEIREVIEDWFINVIQLSINSFELEELLGEQQKKENEE